MRLFSWLAWRSRRDSDLQDEIAAHLAMAASDRIAGGDDPQAAQYAARKEFGNVTLTREATRLTWGGLWIERLADLARDTAYAFRLLRRSPGYTATVVGVVAVGIACNVIVFSLYKALALKPLAGVADSGSLYYVGDQPRTGQTMPLSYPEYKDIRARALPALAGSSVQRVILGQGARGQLVSVEFVTGNYFATLGVAVQFGRTLLPSDEVAIGKHPVVVLGDGLWRRAFGADPAIVGQTVHLNAEPMTVVGVAAPDFRGSIVGLSADLFTSILMQPRLLQYDDISHRGNHGILAFLRLPSGAAVAQAREHAARISTELAAEFPDHHTDARLVPIWEWPYGAQSYMLPAVGLMGAMAGLLLVVVCANVAGLVLVRGVGRRGEVAARLALGASRLRIVRQLMIESVVLAVPAAALGLFLPRLIEPFIAAAQPKVALPLFFNVEPDRLVIAFTLLLAWLSALVYGLVPAIRLSRLDLASVLKDDLSPLGPTKAPLRTTLVVAQVALSLILLIGTGLVLRSLASASRADAGFNPDQVSWVTLDVRAAGHTEAEGRRFYEQLLDVIATDPTLQTSALASFLPLTIIDWQNWGVKPEGHEQRRNETLNVALNTVTPGYFETLRIPLLAGRDFNARDNDAAEQVAVVNETFARRFWGSPAAAIGKRFEANGWRTIVGVARDMKYARLDESPRPYFYIPFAQQYASGLTLEVRTAEPSAGVLERIRAHVRSIDPDMPIVESGLLADQMRSAVSIYETVARVLSLIGVMATALVALGIYGLVAYTVKQSAHEIGIRTALGAAPRDITRRFVASGARLGLLGVVLGVVAAFGVTRLMAQLLYGVSATDVLSFTGAAVLVLAVTLGASLIPAWRASRDTPLGALRHH
jgi:macrolide transport system ATP-binding/permease protein